MKVEIGPFVDWWGPYQIADLLQLVGVSDGKCHKIGAWLADTWVNDVCEWVHSKKKRKVKVHVERYDVWGLDSTLAYIILPALKKLKETKHGAPFTNDEDVPDHVKSTSAPPKENEWDTDALHFERWDWILDEIIWTFEQIHPDYDWEDQYRTGEVDIDFNTESTDGITRPVKFIESPDYHVDYDGMRKHQDRINAGLCLFGKYYQALWD